MKEEMRSMDSENQAFILCDLPPGRRLRIACKWVYRIKHDGNNTFKRFRARIVAKGYSQVFHIDVEKTYAPVIRIGLGLPEPEWIRPARPRPES